MMNSKMIEAQEKLKKQADELGDSMSEMLCQQIMDLIENINDSKVADKVLNSNKSLAGCKKAFDDFAEKNRKGKVSVITPDTAQNLICSYFCFEEQHEQKSNIIDLFSLI